MEEASDSSDRPEKSRDEITDDLAELFGHDPADKWKAPSEGEFAELVTHCLVEGVSRDAMAEEFHVSPQTIDRWSLSMSYPVYFTRRNIMDRLQKLLDQVKPTQ